MMQRVVVSRGLDIVAYVLKVQCQSWKLVRSAEAHKLELHLHLSQTSAHCKSCRSIKHALVARSGVHMFNTCLPTTYVY